MMYWANILNLKLKFFFFKCVIIIFIIIFQYFLFTFFNFTWRRFSFIINILRFLKNFICYYLCLTKNMRSIFNNIFLIKLRNIKISKDTRSIHISYLIFSRNMTSKQITIWHIIILNSINWLVYVSIFLKITLPRILIWFSLLNSFEITLFLLLVS